MKAIATYNEVTLTGKRKYDLYSDNIAIKGVVNFSHDFEQTLILKKIRSDYIRLRIRPTIVWGFLGMFFLPGLACLMLIYEIPIQSDAIPGVLGIVSGSCLIGALASMRKVEYARFCSEDYASVLLRVARSGPEKKQFDSFVQVLVTQIEHAKRLAQESPEGAQ